MLRIKIFKIENREKIHMNVLNVNIMNKKEKRMKIKNIYQKKKCMNKKDS